MDFRIATAEDTTPLDSFGADDVNELTSCCLTNLSDVGTSRWLSRVCNQRSSRLAAIERIALSAEPGLRVFKWITIPGA